MAEARAPRRHHNDWSVRAPDVHPAKREKSTSGLQRSVSAVRQDGCVTQGTSHDTSRKVYCETLLGFRWGVWSREPLTSARPGRGSWGSPRKSKTEARDAPENTSEIQDLMDTSHVHATTLIAGALTQRTLSTQLPALLHHWAWDACVGMASLRETLTDDMPGPPGRRGGGRWALGAGQCTDTAHT